MIHSSRPRKVFASVKKRRLLSANSLLHLFMLARYIVSSVMKSLVEIHFCNTLREHKQRVMHEGRLEIKPRIEGIEYELNKHD